MLQHLHPIDEMRGFTSEIFLNEVDQQHLRPVRNLLTAGSSLRVVARDKNDTSRYYVHADLYTTLARIRARELAMDAAGRRPIEGGPLRQAAIADARAGSACSPTAARPSGRAGPTDDELRAQFQDAPDRGARADARRAAQDRGAGDRRSGSERRASPEAPGAARITGSTSS